MKKTIDKLEKLLRENTNSKDGVISIQINSEKTIVVNGDYSEDNRIDDAGRFINRTFGK